MRNQTLLSGTGAFALALVGTLAISGCPTTPPDECTSNTDCDTGFTCDLDTNTCEAESTGCTSDDECTAPETCNLDTNVCEEPAAGSCTDHSECNATESCNAGTCEAADTTSTDGQIQAFLDATAGTGLALPVDDALVTYIRPANGDDPAGFFLQADADGPAMFVGVDPAALDPMPAVGDRVDLVVDEKDEFRENETALGVSGWNVDSSGHPVQNLASDTPAGLLQDVTDVDFTAGYADYHYELVTITGNLTGSFGYEGNNFSGSDMATTGVPTADFQLRFKVPDELLRTGNIATGCDVTLLAGPLWGDNGAEAQPAAFYESDVELSNCPAPTLLSAWALDATHAELRFDRRLDADSVTAADFAADNGLTIDAVAVDGKTVILTTSSQASGTSYSVTVEDELLDEQGSAVDLGSPVSASFWGFNEAPTGIVINEVDAAVPGTDANEYIELFNNSGSDVAIGGLQIVLINGSKTEFGPDRPYNVVPLHSAVDGNDVFTETLPAGGYLVIGPQSTVLDGIADTAVLRVALNGTNLVQNGADGVALIDYASGMVLDGVFYDTPSEGTTAVVWTGMGDVVVDALEGTNAVDDPDDGSLQRCANGADTDDNSADFIVAPITPGETNSCA